MARFLARDRFEAARRFVADGARPLDRALLDLALGAGSAQTALAALAIYQNVDGGFGRGLEPDLSSPASSAIATSIGLRLLARLGAPSDHPMVQGAVRWLDANLDRTTGVWPIIGPGVELAPHAPWWTWSQDMAGSDSVAGAKNGFRFNPTDEILGLLYLYRGGVPAPLIDATETGMRQAIAETELIKSAYDLKCALRLAETGAAPADLALPLTSLVLRSVAARDPGDAHARTLDLAPTPASLAAAALSSRIDDAVAVLIEGQQPDGGWTPFWDWSSVDARAWEKAKRDSRGWLTREALETLMAHGRAEAARGEKA